MTDALFIQSAAQVSLQEPLSEQWLYEPIRCEEPYRRSLEPNFRDFIPPLEARRMGKILKRAVVTSKVALQKAGIEQPDAIVTGTGLGCIESTEFFLDALCREGEDMLKPTHFMQSTHNTISSTVGIQTVSHGYNTTYSHRSVSFDCALWDAWTQLRLGRIDNALVGGHDELTPSYYTLLCRTGYMGYPGMTVCSETAVSMVLSRKAEGSLCRLDNMVSLYRPTPDRLLAETQNMLEGIPADSLAFVCGHNGNPANDEPYRRLLEAYSDSAQADEWHYKPLFGENYTASGLGLYAAAHALAAGTARVLSVKGRENAPKHLLFVNHSNAKVWTLVKLSSL